MANSLAARLADATPWVLRDAFLIGLALFLMSRLWVLVAPRLGRTLTRWCLLVGVPLVFVVSAVGHTVTPERALALSEGVGFAAFVVCFPLAAIWVVSLLVWVGRKLLRREAGAGRSLLPRSTEAIRIAAVTLPVVGLVGVVEWAAARDEVKAMEARAADLRKSIRALEATEQRADEFEHEGQKLAQKLDVMSSIVPPAPALDELVERIERQAGEYGIRVLDWSSSLDQAVATLQEHQLTMVLDGKLENLKELMERSVKLARLFSWRRVSVSGKQATALLVVYSSPNPAPKAASRDICSVPLSNVWLWPYSARVSEPRAEVERLCVERSRYASTSARVDEFQARKARLEDLVLAVDEVMKDRKKPAVVIEGDPLPAEAEIPGKRT